MEKRIKKAINPRLWSNGENNPCTGKAFQQINY
jgi:hypothetical protein